jgi:hypothetical protein
MKEIEITIYTDGRTTYDLKGYGDATCLKETEEFQQAMGKVTKQTKKAEAYKTSAAQTVAVGKKA